MRDYRKDAYDKIKGTEKHDRVKKQMRKCSKELYDKSKTRMCEDENRSTKKTCIAERLEKFNESVKQGPYYVCVSCNRCHYMRSIVQFKEERYNLQEDDVFTDVLSFDGKKYICHTCHKKLMKGNIPDQAVFNKLQVHRLPFELMDVRKLEKAIIARRFLFKKVTIMPKGQMPKIKGAICNVPFDTGEVFNVLPRGSDSTGIVMVKLKRKLMYTGHVIFEPVRPEKVELLLEYLKVNNHFYKDIVIDTDNIDPDFLSFGDNEDLEAEDENYDRNRNELLEEVENPLNKHCIGANETALISTVPCQLSDDDIVISPGQGKKPLSLTRDKNCEELAHLCLLPTGKFGIFS